MPSTLEATEQTFRALSTILASDEPDLDDVEAARDAITEVPPALLLLVDSSESPSTTLHQHAALCTWAADVLINGVGDESINEAAVLMVVRYLLKLGAQSELMSDSDELHHAAATALSLVHDDAETDNHDAYLESLEMTQAALGEFVARAMGSK